jgi:hypothetical protein
MGCCENTVYNHIASGELRAVNIAVKSSKTKLRISEDAFDDFLERRQVP